jgi:ribosome-associated toxin RatA of RatAB toxin-antitoxin module
VHPTYAATESALERTQISASPSRCYDVAADIASYPEWAQGITAVEIVDVDSQGRVTTATFIAEAIGRQTRYTLDYDYADAPSAIRWSQRAGDLTTRVDGAYTFAPSPMDPDITDVSYELSIGLAVPLPGFVKRRAEAKIVGAALGRFRERVENLS